MTPQELFYLLGTVASILAIATCLTIIVTVYKIFMMIQAARFTLSAVARTRVAGGALTLIPLLINAFLRRKRTQ